MMSLAGVSTAVVPAFADPPVALGADRAPGTPTAGTAAALGGAAATAPDDEAAELPEHPASSVPPASMAPPTIRPAAAPNRVRADREVKLILCSMPF
jgi:hypothetical protein